MAKKPSEKDVLATARRRMTMAIAAWSDSREDELDDLRFLAGDPSNQWQWPADVLATRNAVQGQTINARPCLTINKLPQHVREVTNDQRQNRPGIKVIPVDDKADVKVAEMMEGMCRHIEYISNADVAYDTACDNQVTFGEGYLRLVTEYCSPDSFDQELKIKRVRNSFSVYMDPMIQDPCGQDAEWVFVTEDILHEDYERQWPDAMPISSIQDQGVGDSSLNQWVAEDTVRIADYYYIQHEKATLNLYPGNVTAIKGTPEDAHWAQYFPNAVRTREVDVRRVKWLKINGYEVLEETDWAGQFIPVIRIVGNEYEVEGRVYVSGLVRNAKDAQRMYNYWVSQEAEMLALAPKAPFIGYGGQFEGYEQQWKTANTQNYPYLEVNPDVTDGNGGVLPLPQRAMPPMAQTGLIQAKMGAADDIKATTGQYDSSLGQTSNERSGKAILARERQTDTGTYHYGDNLSRGVRYLGRQIVDLIPKIYDTQRIARIMGLDGETSTVKINPNQPEPVKEITDPQNPDVVVEKIYNPGVGKYDVCVATGPGYMTKRQESLEAMSQLLQGNPQLWAVAGDLFIKNMDWPGAQEMAARFAKTIDPKLLTDEDKSPQLQAAEQQIQAMGAELQNMHTMLQKVPQSFEAQDLKIKEMDTQIKAYEAETKRIAAVANAISPDQIQDIVLGTLHAAIASGDVMGRAAELGETEEAPGQPEQPEAPVQNAPMQPPMAAPPQNTPAMP